MGTRVFVSNLTVILFLLILYMIENDDFIGSKSTF